ncbi:MAG: hypothetical protein ABIK77_05125 [candidate division WOR-3 bacterium]
MIRKINFTGRQRIEQKYFSITKKDEKTFEISFNNFEEFKNEYNISGNNKIYVEVYNRYSELVQFEFNPPSQRIRVENLTDTDTIKFRIIVVDEKNKIIASAEKIKPFIGEERQGILDVKFEDLGNRIWKLEFDGGEEGGPLLYINKKIPQNLAKSDPSFIIYVYPFVLKDILYYICFHDDFNIEDPKEEWHKEWIEFIKFIDIELIEEGKKYFQSKSDENKEEKLNWIEKIVDKFCEKRKKEWEEFINKLEGGKE